MEIKGTFLGYNRIGFTRTEIFFKGDDSEIVYKADFRDLRGVSAKIPMVVGKTVVKTDFEKAQPVYYGWAPNMEIKE